MPWSSETRACRELLFSMPGYGHLKLIRETNQLTLDDELVEPLHVFFRFSGRSRHDSAGGSTPILGAVGLLRTMRSLSAAQTAATTVTVMLSGAGDTAVHRKWFARALAPATVRIVTAPPSNAASYLFQQKLVMDSAGDERTIVFLVEDDFLHTADMLSRVLSFFRAYNPCMVVPYDYPDRYTRTFDEYQRHWYTKTIVLKGDGIHWRSTISSTVTYAARLHVFRDVLRIRGKRGMPGPLYAYHDHYQSLFIASALGLFSPMPSLSSHYHRDSELTTTQPAIASPDFPTARVVAELRELAITVDFPNASAAGITTTVRTVPSPPPPPPLANHLCEPSQYGSALYSRGDATPDAHVTLAFCRDAVYPVYSVLTVPPHAPFVNNGGVDDADRGACVLDGANPISFTKADADAVYNTCYLLEADDDSGRRCACTASTPPSTPLSPPFAVLGSVAFRKPAQLINLWRSIDVSLSTFVLVENAPSNEVQLAIQNHMARTCQNRTLPVWMASPENPSHTAKTTLLRECTPRHNTIRALHVLRFMENEGCSVAWNAILRHGLGLGAPYVLVVNDDIVFSANALGSLHSFVMAHLESQPAFIATMAQDVNGRLVRFKGSWGAFTLTSGFIKSAGYFDENFFPPFYEDTDMMIRRVLLRIPVYSVPNASFIHSGHKTADSGHGSLLAQDRDVLKSLARRACSAIYLAEKWSLHVKYDKWGWGRFAPDVTKPRPSNSAVSAVWRKFIDREVAMNDDFRFANLEDAGDPVLQHWASMKVVLAAASQKWVAVDADRARYIRSEVGNDMCYHCLPDKRTAANRPVCTELKTVQHMLEG